MLLALLLTHGVCTECRQGVLCERNLRQITASESLHPTDRSVRKKTTFVKTRDVIVGMNNYVSSSLEDYMNDNMFLEPTRFIIFSRSSISISVWAISFRISSRC